MDRPGYIDLSRGPKENRTRPAINPLFRSAAQAYGPNVIGVILSGVLDDDVAGLAEIKRNGGVALVQDPKTAIFADMPDNAIEQVEVDYVLFVQTCQKYWYRSCPSTDPHQKTGWHGKHPSIFTCPECRGPMSKYRLGEIRELRCRVGHAYSLLSFAEEHRVTAERNFWEVMVALEESAEIVDRLGLHFGDASTWQAKNRREQAAIIKHMLSNVRPRPKDG